VQSEPLCNEITESDPVPQVLKRNVPAFGAFQDQKASQPVKGTQPFGPPLPSNPLVVGERPYRLKNPVPAITSGDAQSSD
tara:strand:+ start:561 stop:800 length:240 start_codon:yes stop_codon:yes gene_type:complete